MVVLNDDPVELFVTSQFQPPSDSCSVSNRSMIPGCLPKGRVLTRPPPAIDTRLHLTCEEGLLITFLRAATHPNGCTRSRTVPRALRAWLLADGEPISRQQHQDAHGGIPSTIPGSPPHRPSVPWRASNCAGMPSVATRARSASDLFRGRTGRVSHHLPSDRRVRIKQPLYHRSLWRRDLPFSCIECHLLLVLESVTRRCWWPNESESS